MLNQNNLTWSKISTTGVRSQKRASSPRGNLFFFFFFFFFFFYSLRQGGEDFSIYIVPSQQRKEKSADRPMQMYRLVITIFPNATKSCLNLQ